MLRFCAEIHFWSEIMENHAEFMLGALSSREAEVISRAQYFKNAWAGVHREISQVLPPGPCSVPPVYVDYLLKILHDFIDLKRIILKQLLACSIEISLPPSFLGHMMNEAHEFERILSPSETCRENPAHAIMHLHEVWLTDASGHAATIAGDLDPSEALYVHQAVAFQNTFMELRDKALELAAALERTCLYDGAVQELTAQVEGVMNDFMCFLEKMRLLRQECKVLGTFKPLIPDHMLREETYYLNKVRGVQ
jgi:hypothetical protein